MKKIILMLMASAILGISCTKEPALTPQQQNLQSKMVGDVTSEAEQGTLLIKVTEEAIKKISEGSLKPATLLGSLKEASIEPLFPSGIGNSDASEIHGLNRWYTVTFDESISLNQAAEILAQNVYIQSIQYNTLIAGTGSNLSFDYIPALNTKSAAASSWPFNDPQLPVQWNLINDGSITETAVAGADVGVKDAWRLTAGDPRIVVAVFDQGVAVTHPDLKDNLWVNEAELNGKDGEDDDGNTYKDDKHGYNFAENKGKPSAKYNADHGTHIAGTIAATNNNGLGVSSIAGGTGVGDGVRIMSCQIFDERGSKTSPSKIAEAFKYAADHGASIAQCSYGESDKGFASDNEYKADNGVEYDALAYFLDPANANCDALETNIAVFASGNYNSPASLYPGALKGCISVTAFCPDFLPGGYSNYGAGCDIAAPGGDIVENDAEAPSLILSTGYGKTGQLSYVYKYGTSMACPHVSGVVALGMSYALKLGKTFSREDFISRLLTSAKDIDSYNIDGAKKLRVEGRDYVETDVFTKKGKMGTGAVDAWQFLMALEGTPTVIVKTGEKAAINIADYIGCSVENLDFSLSMDKESKSSLGIEENPVLKDGILTVTCTKSGAGKICLSSSVGGHEQISGLDFSREISIVSRVKPASNGGWL